jgi:hypothetical protein
VELSGQDGQTGQVEVEINDSGMGSATVRKLSPPFAHTRRYRLEDKHKIGVQPICHLSAAVPELIGTLKHLLNRIYRYPFKIPRGCQTTIYLSYREDFIFHLLFRPLLHPSLPLTQCRTTLQTPNYPPQPDKALEAIFYLPIRGHRRRAPLQYHRHYRQRWQR